jgi:hypothetical protein
MPLSALLECEAPTTVAASGAPFRLSYATARTVADDPIFQLWKGPTSSGTNKVFEVDKDGEVNTGAWKGTVVAAQYGGTGLDGSAAANGKVLIGNGSGYTLATISAGTGISVTNGAGSISIAATGATPTQIANGDGSVSVGATGGITMACGSEDLTLSGATTTGTAGALVAYLGVVINGTQRRIPYYAI